MRDNRASVCCQSSCVVRPQLVGAAVSVLTHIDVFPAGNDETTALAKGLAEVARKAKGAERFAEPVWDGHPNHFYLIEVWTDPRAPSARRRRTDQNVSCQGRTA